MDIVEEIIEEKAMSGKLKSQRINTKGGDTTDTDSPEKSKSKKRSESSLDKVDPKNMKITLPSSKSDDCSLSSHVSIFPCLLGSVTFVKKEF